MLQDIQSFLFSLRNQGSKYGLERMEAWAGLLGNPQDQLKCIHVAGTNGKGSTCAMLESVFRKAGYRVGLFTSPHLVYLGERVQVDRVPIAIDTLVVYVEKLKTSAERLEVEGLGYPSFFEFMTMIAFLYFVDSKVDIAIIEVGLGGRLDATNIISKPLVSVITSIGLDHTHILGDTLEAIASEKAGIIKKNCPVVLGSLPPEAISVMQERATICDAPFYVSDMSVEDVEVGLWGAAQQLNARTVMKVCEVLNHEFEISEQVLSEGLRTVRWRGRWEVLTLAGKGQLILEAAHNEEGIAALDKSIMNLDTIPRVWVVASMEEGRARALLELASKYAEKIVLVQPQNERALSVDALRALVSGLFKGEVLSMELGELFPCPGVCALSYPGSPVLVVGSLYLIGDVLERLEGKVVELGATFQDRM